MPGTWRRGRLSFLVGPVTRRIGDGHLYYFKNKGACPLLFSLEKIEVDGEVVMVNSHGEIVKG